jgi:hypothetical protein
MGELIEEDEVKEDAFHVKLPGSKKFRSLYLPCVRKSKKAERLEEKPKSIDVTRPEMPSASADVGAGATPIIVAAALGTAAELSLLPLPTSRNLNLVRRTLWSL